MDSSGVQPDCITVFVVDDDPAFLRAIKRLLEAADYTVETFESAHELLQRETFPERGCLIADLRMPGQSGLDLQDKLNELEYAIPIVFLTGAGDIESSVTAMKHGAVDFLPKPVEKEVLFSVIEEALEKDRRGREQFGISEKTVKAHRGRVMHKVGARSIIDLAALSELAFGVSE
jgi:FixJ family two-component response regulator